MAKAHYERGVINRRSFLLFTSTVKQTDETFKEKFQDLLTGVNLMAVPACKNLKTGKSVSINADTLIPTAV